MEGRHKSTRSKRKGKEVLKASQVLKRTQMQESFISFCEVRSPKILKEMRETCWKTSTTKVTRLKQTDKLFG